MQAFEDALNDQRQRSGYAKKYLVLKKTTKSSRSGSKQSRRASVLEDDDAESSTHRTAPTPENHAYAAVHGNGYNHSFSHVQSSANGYAAASAASEHGANNDVYQAAYAQAYAHLQAQFQAAYQTAPPTQHPGGFRYGSQHVPGYPSHSFQPQMAGHMPAAGPMPQFPTGLGVHPAAEGNDDGLSNLLLAWYQSGYYTGRYQAIQEMKARSHR